MPWLTSHPPVQVASARILLHQHQIVGVLCVGWGWGVGWGAQGGRAWPGREGKQQGCCELQEWLQLQSGSEDRTTRANNGQAASRLAAVSKREDGHTRPHTASHLEGGVQRQHVAVRQLRVQLDLAHQHVHHVGGDAVEAVGLERHLEPGAPAGGLGRRGAGAWVGK